MATIQKHKNGYYIQVFLGRDINGKKRTKSTIFHPTETAPTKVKKEVERFASKYEEQVRAHADGYMSFHSYVENKWLSEYAETNLSERDRDEYLDYLRKDIYPFIGTTPIIEITPQMLQDIITHLNARGLKPTTVARKFKIISGILGKAYKRNLIPTNPCKGCDLPKDERIHVVKRFTVKEAQTFLSALSKTYSYDIPAHVSTNASGKPFLVAAEVREWSLPLVLRIFYTMALLGGFRRSELAGLTWEAVDFENKKVAIRQGITRTKSGQKAKSTKNRSSNRDVVLDDFVFQMLKKWKLREKCLSMQFEKWEGYHGASDFDKNYIFVNEETGKVLSLDYISKKFKEVVKRYNAECENDADKLPENLSLKDLRSTSGSILVDAGTNIEEVQKRLGHARTSTTVNFYIGSVKSADEDASDTIGNLLLQKNA